MDDQHGSACVLPTAGIRVLRIQRDDQPLSLSSPVPEGNGTDHPTGRHPVPADSAGRELRPAWQIWDGALSPRRAPVWRAADALLTAHSAGPAHALHLP